MNFLPMSWRNDRVGRKRESDESIHEIEAARKRTRPDEDSMGKKEGEAEADAEQRIFIPARSGACSSPRDALPSLPPQPVQIDRIVNFSDNNQDQEYPSGPWSKGPQYISSLPGHSERSKPQHSTSHPNLRIDTVRALSNLNPRSPGYTATEASKAERHSHPPSSELSDENSPHSSAHNPQERPRVSVDSYRPSCVHPSRRSSEIMAPPARAGTQPPRSESSTPKTLSRKALPPQQGLSTSPQVSLSDSLGGFAESIASAARLTFKQEISHQQQAAYERERERQHKYKATFITLVEDIETKIEDVSKSNANLDKQVDHHAKAQTDVTKKLESALEAMRVNTSPLENTHDSKSAKNGSDSSSKDFEKLQTDLRAARDDIAYLKRKAVMESDLDVHFSRLVPREELRRFVTADELSAAENRAAKKQEDHSAKLAALTPIVNHTSQRISELSGIIDKRQNLAEEKLQLQGKRISNLDNGMDAADTKIAGWEKMVETQNHERSALKKDIEDYRSTVANLVAFVEGDVLKLTNLANDNFNDIRKIQASVNELCEHIQLAKTEQNPLRCIPSTPSTFKTEAEITEKLGLLQVDLDSLKEAEEKRDESVTTELAQLDSLLNRHAADLSRLQNDVQTMKQNTQQNQSVHPFHTTHPHSPPPSSTFSSPREPNHQKLQDLEMDIRNLHDRTASLQVFMDSQQQKYDQFTTDRVVHSMIHQMQQLYPQHPGNTLAQINQMGRKLAGVEAFLTSNLNSCLGAIDARFANMDIAIAARVGADSIQNLDKKMQEILKTGNEKSNMLVNVSKALSAEIAKSEQFKRTVIGVHGVQIKILSNTLGELSKKFEKLEKDTEQLTTLANDIPHLARDVSILNKELDDSPQFSRGADSAPRDLINAPLKTRKDLDEDLLTARRSSSRPESHSSDREEPLAKSNGVEPDEKAGKSPEKVTTSNSGIHGESGCNSDDQDSDDDIFPTATSRRVKYRAKIGRSPELKRRRVESSDYGDFGVPASTNSKKVPKRKNVSGRNPLA